MGEYSKRSFLIVDDHELIRIGLITALKSKGVDEIEDYGRSSEALRALRRRSFSFAIIDKNLGTENGVSDGIQLASTIKKKSPETLAILLTFESSWHVIEEARLSGINGVVDKSLPLYDLIEITERIEQNPRHFISTSAYKPPLAPTLLTKTEMEILVLLKSGITTREIAAQRLNSEATIKSHLTSIYRKLGARNRIEALAFLN